MPLSAVDTARYDQLLNNKVAKTTHLLAPHHPPHPEVYASAPTGYRMRAEFRMWHDGDRLDYVMFRKDEPRTPVPINTFPIACSRIQSLMPQLLELLTHNLVLRTKLFQIEFLTASTDEMLVTLIYHRKLDDAWHGEAEKLASELGIELIGRSRKQKRVLNRDFVEEELCIDGTRYRYRQYEQAFTQPNARVNTRMIEWACSCATKLEGDLLELYCGNGNFTLALSQHFGRVIATEVSKTSIRAARENTAANLIENIDVIRMSAEEVSQAMRAERSFRRLADLPKPLQSYHLNTVFVDPPRAGLDKNTESMLAGFDNIIYISCNPVTLNSNLQSLCQTHTIKKFALFDQFPYTEHMECGVFLTRTD